MPKNVTQTLYGADLDLTNHRTINREKLMQVIEDECSQAIMFVGRHHPDKLLITMNQFKALEHDTQLMDATEDRIYLTKKGFVLEVHIVVDKPDWEALIAKGEGVDMLTEDGEELGINWDLPDNAPDKSREELLGGENARR